VGVGCMEGQTGVNWKFFGITFASWVSTLGIMGGGTALCFAQAVYAPCA
jgi:sodium-dependent phosphate transporter